MSRTEDTFSERNAAVKWFMNGLVAAQTGSLILILYGFIYTQFFQ